MIIVTKSYYKSYYLICWSISESRLKVFAWVLEFVGLSFLVMLASRMSYPTVNAF